jgi:hypothetical protein
MTSFHTTIKVTSDLRDRLKEQAAEDGRTLAEHLSLLADLGDRKRRFAELKSAIDSTPQDQKDSYLDEAAEWESIDRE